MPLLESGRWPKREGVDLEFGEVGRDVVPAPNRGRRVAPQGATVDRASRLFALVPVDVLVVATLILLAAAFRLNGIGNQSLWLDEIGEATTARLPLDLLFSSIRDDAAATPLDYLGVRLVTGLLGTGTVATRMWSVAIACLAVGAVYFAALRLFRSRSAGALAAIILCTAPFAIYYGQEARFYSLAMLVTALSFLTFLRAWQEPGVKPWLIFACSGALVLYTHYFAATVLFASQTTFVLSASIGHWLKNGRSRTAFRSGVWRVAAFAASLSLAIAMFGPWLLYATLPELGRTYNVPLPPPLDSTQISAFLTQISGGLVESVAGTLAAAVVLAACAGALLAIVTARLEVAVLIGATGLAIPVAWLADTHAHYFWTSRQIAFVVPLLAILAGGGLWGLVLALAAFVRRTGRSRRPEAGLVVLVGVAWIFLSWSPIQRIYAGDLPKDDWRGVTRLVAQTACPDATFHVNIPAHYQFGIGYYDPSLTQRSRYLAPGPEDLADQATKISVGPHDWVIVLTYAPGVGSIEALSSRMAEAGWVEHTFISIRAFERVSPCAS
jgi:hypothetical protein